VQPPLVKVSKDKWKGYSVWYWWRNCDANY